MNEIQELLAKLLLLQNNETRNLTELGSRIKTSMDAGSVLDFRARCLNAKFLLESNIVRCRSNIENNTWVSQCNYLINACQLTLLKFSQETIVEWLQSSYFKNNKTLF